MMIPQRLPLRVLALLFLVAACARADTLRITEVVTDPQGDHNESSGGNGTLFDAVPGTCSITSSDEFIELRNFGSELLDLTGHVLQFNDSTAASYTFGSSSAGTLRFTAGSTLTALEPGAFVLLGNPPGAMNNTIGLLLLDADGDVLDQWDLVGDVSGNATGASDEAVLKAPNGEMYAHVPISPLAESPFPDLSSGTPDSENPAPTPEPGTLWLLALTGAGAAAARLRTARCASRRTPSRSPGRCASRPAGSAAGPGCRDPHSGPRESA